MIFVNFVLLLILIRLRSVLGPFLGQSIKVAFGLMKDPNLFLHFLNSKTAVIEWRAYNQVVKLDPEEVTSELVYVDRENSFTPTTPIRPNYGLFGFLKKKPASQRMNEIYTDDFVPIKTNSTKNFWAFGKQMHVIYEGQNMTMNPLANFTQDAQVKKAGIAVEHQLQANKLLVINDYLNKLATKGDVQMYGLLNLILLGFGIIALLVMVIGMQGALTEFAKFATDTFNAYKPAIEAFLKDIPRVVEA